MIVLAGLAILLFPDGTPASPLLRRALWLYLAPVALWVVSAYVLAAGAAGFSHTETCERLSVVKGSRFQLAQRSRKRSPASCAIRSSSDGHTYRNGIVRYSPLPSVNST
jgi:hypothetical protein